MAVLRYKDENGVYHDIVGINVQNEVVQATGTSTTAVMSQNAVTNALSGKADSSDVYTKVQVDAKIADTVHLSAQTLTTAEKDQVAQNLNNRLSTNGMARIELKATDNFKSVVEAQTGGNTMFVIKYDFTLTGDVTIPNGCILEFEGGSISGAYTITGNDTQIKAQDVAIFKSGVIIAGTWICPRITSDWFSDITLTNRLQQLINLSNDNVDNHIIVKAGNYSVDQTVDDWEVGCLIIKSNTKFEVIGTITLEPNSGKHYQIILVKNKNNVTLCGSGAIIGDKDTHTGTTTESEWGYCVDIVNSKDIIVKGLTIQKGWGDSIMIEGDSQGVTIVDCELSDSRRQGITVGQSKSTIIENCYIHDIAGTAPKSCIDVEPDSELTAVDVIIRNNILSNPNNKCITVGGMGGSQNVSIENNSMSGGVGVHITARSIKTVIHNNSIYATVSGVDFGLGGEVEIRQNNISTPNGNGNAITFARGTLTIDNNVLLGTLVQDGDGSYQCEEVFITNNRIGRVTMNNTMGVFKHNFVYSSLAQVVIVTNFCSDNILEIGGDSSIYADYVCNNIIKSNALATNQMGVQLPTPGVMVCGNKIQLIAAEGTSFYAYFMNLVDAYIAGNVTLGDIDNNYFIYQTSNSYAYKNRSITHYIGGGTLLNTNEAFCDS